MLRPERTKEPPEEPGEVFWAGGRGRNELGAGRTAGEREQSGRPRRTISSPVGQSQAMWVYGKCGGPL